MHHQYLAGPVLAGRACIYAHIYMVISDMTHRKAAKHDGKAHKLHMFQDPDYPKEAQQPQHADDADVAVVRKCPATITPQRTHPGALCGVLWCGVGASYDDGGGTIYVCDIALMPQLGQRLQLLLFCHTGDTTR